jgi:hypothetical protein
MYFRSTLQARKGCYIAHHSVTSSTSYRRSVPCPFLSFFLPFFTFTSCEPDICICPTFICIHSSHRERNTIVLVSYSFISFSSGGHLYFWTVMFITIRAQWKQPRSQCHQSLSATSCMKPDMGGKVLLPPV